MTSSSSIQITHTYGSNIQTLSSYVNGPEWNKAEIQNVDLEVAETKRSTLVVGPVKIGRKPLMFKIAGELMSDGIMTTSFSGGGDEAHSIQFWPEDTADANNLLELEELIRDVKGVDDSWEIRPLIKNDMLNLKLKFDKEKTSYKFLNNFKANPAKPKNCNLMRGQALEAYVSAGAYFSIEDHKCGIYLTLQKLELVNPAPKDSTVIAPSVTAAALAAIAELKEPQPVIRPTTEPPSIKTAHRRAKNGY